ncbi:MAG: DUF1203 domain-containing protein [Flavobacteriaceae bacterium]
MFRAIAIDSEAAKTYRETHRGAGGREGELWRAEGHLAPCRHCLRDVGMEGGVVLIAHSPFAGEGPFAETGPIFVCGEACARAELEAGELPEIVLRRPVSLRAYDRREKMLYPHNRVVDGAAAGAAIAAILDDASVERVHVRTRDHGCFLCAVVRA